MVILIWIPLRGIIEAMAGTTETTDPAGAADAAGAPAAGHAHHGYISEQAAYLRRLKLVEGQVRGLQQMVSDEKYCIDILTQISATTAALRSVALGLLDDHMAHCVVDAAAKGGAEADQKLAEVSDAIKRLSRS